MRMLAVVVVLALAMTLLPAAGAQAQRRNQVVIAIWGLPTRLIGSSEAVGGYVLLQIHDVLKAMIADGARLVVLGRNEKLSDLPEFADAKQKPGFDEARYLDYTAERKLMVVPEENVLALPGDPVAGRCLAIGVFARGLHQVTGLRGAIPDFDQRRDRIARGSGGDFRGGSLPSEVVLRSDRHR